MGTTLEIKEKRRELEELENEYLQNTPACQNEKCGLWSNNTSGNCRWSVLLEDCDDYKPELDNL